MLIIFLGSKKIFLQVTWHFWGFENFGTSQLSGSLVSRDTHNFEFFSPVVYRAEPQLSETCKQNFFFNHVTSQKSIFPKKKKFFYKKRFFPFLEGGVPTIWDCYWIALDISFHMRGHMTPQRVNTKIMDKVGHLSIQTDSASN